MDASRFDSCSRALGEVRSRRGVTRLIAGLAVVGSASGLPWSEAAAKQHKHKHKQHKKTSRPSAPPASPPSPPPPPGPTCAGKLISDRCVLGCGNACVSHNGICANGFQDTSQLFCVPKATAYCVAYPTICTQDAGCAPTELCALTACGPGGADQGRCAPIFPA
jgi:hypothetical protein